MKRYMNSDVETVNYRLQSERIINTAFEHIACE